jgi:hypothetical protein
MFAPDAVSHSLMVLSSPPDAMVRPSGEKDTERTTLELPVSVLMFDPDVASHSLMVLSPLADAMVRLSGEKTTE